MTTARGTISRGALLVALMAGSSALAGGTAYADVLGGAGPVPLPAPLPSVPLLPEAAPSPSPSPSATAAPAEQPVEPSGTQADPPASSNSGSTTAAESTTTTTSEVAAANETAPAPVAAPAPAAPAQAPVATRPVAAQPLRVSGPVAPLAARPVAASAPSVVAPPAAARLDRAEEPLASGLGSFSGFPQLTAGSLQLPALPNLPGLRPMIAPGQSAPLAPLLTGGVSTPQLPLVRTGHSAPIQPGSTGVVLFVMASAAGAAGLARVRIYRKGVIRG